MGSATPADGAEVLRGAFSSCRRHLLYAAVFSGLLNLLLLAPTLYMLQVYDRVMPTRGTATLVFLTLILLATLGALSFLDNVRARLLLRASARFNEIVAEPLLAAVLGRSDIPHGVRATAMRQFDSLRQILTGPGIVALFDAPWAPLYVLICFILHPAVGLLAIVGGAALLGLGYLNERATAAPIRSAGDAEALSHLSQDFSMRSRETVRALGMKRALVARHLAERDRAVALQGCATVVSSLYMAWTKFVRLFLQSAALGLGAYLAIHQQISAAAVFACSLMLARALAPLEQVVGAWRNVVAGRSAYGTLKTVFAAASSVARTRLPAPAGRFSVKDVTVASPSGDGMILQGVSLDVEAGQCVGVVGPSGAGKTTLLRVLSGAVKPDGGELRIDGARVEDWEEDDLARHVGYLPQDPNLFPGTIRDNIARFAGELEADQRAIDAQVVAAAQAAGCHDLVLRLPRAYDTVLGPGGAGLSAGQSQRVALARALYGEPQIVVLDEPNAHLDTRGENILAECLGALRERGATVFISAHRTGVLAQVDTILILNGGQVHACGPRDQFLKPLRPVAGAPANPVVPFAHRSVGA